MTFLEFLHFFWVSIVALVILVLACIGDDSDLRKGGYTFVFLLVLLINWWAIDPVQYRIDKTEEFIQVHNFDKAHQELDRIKENLTGTGILASKSAFKGHSMEEDYEPLFNKLFLTEATSLINDNTLAAQRGVISLVQKLHVVGTPMPGVTSTKSVIKDNDEYAQNVSKYNNLIGTIYSQAIAMKQTDLASNLLMYFKQNLTKKTYETHLFKRDEYVYSFSSEDIDRAKQQLADLTKQEIPQEKEIQKVVVVEKTIIAETPVASSTTIETRIASTVDTNIPTIRKTNNNTFAVIFANEDYKNVEPVKYALNDGNIFKKYCIHTLGVPSKNIRYIENATLNDMRNGMDWLSSISQIYGEEASIIIYYAGHGIPNESNKNPYLLPVDGYAKNIKTGYDLSEFISEASQMGVKLCSVFLDACFSGTKREEGMLASARGVAIRAKPCTPEGHVVLFSAAKDDETAFPIDDEGHGIFTYFLLKKLQESKGDVTLQELGNYICKNVSKVSIMENNKPQTPTMIASELFGEEWKQMKLIPTTPIEENGVKTSPQKTRSRRKS